MTFLGLIRSLSPSHTVVSSISNDSLGIGSGLFKFGGLFNLSGFGMAHDGPSNAVEAVVVVVDEEFGGDSLFVDFGELRGA